MYLLFVKIYFYFRDDELEQDLIFIPSPIKSSNIINNRNDIFSTPQPEQSGPERYNIFKFTIFLTHRRVDE